MVNKRTLSLIVVVFITVAFAFGGLALGAAQRKKPRTQKAQPAQVAPVDPHAKKRGELADAIAKACDQLHLIINGTNVSYTEYPYDLNQPVATFINDCKQNGTLSWVATSHYDSSDTAYPTAAVGPTTVSLQVQNLDMARLSSENGCVKLESTTPSINVQGTMLGVAQTETRRKWLLDLRYERCSKDRDYCAQKFVDSIRGLRTSLDDRDKLPAAVAAAK